jgi:ABC-type dipeptide/oligopeptide/nickel transport system permease subunit
MAEKSKSYLSSAWKKLKSNKTAMAGLLLIIAAAFTAVFAYWLAPDHSPFANRMIVEIGGKKPGYRQRFLILSDSVQPATDILTRTLSGEKDFSRYIPITTYKINGDSIVAQVFLDEGVTSETKFDISHQKYFITERRFLLGTDKFGRDILSRLIIGTRVSLSVGMIAVLISLLIGVTLGALAGYFKGRTDTVIMWLINVIWTMPTLLLVFAITMALGKGFWQVFIAVGLTLWVNVARLIRGQVLSIRELEYVEAARSLGYSHGRIIIRHILPNLAGPVIVISASNFASAIIIEAGLSFLGAGVQSPQPSWGLMIRENYNFIITHNPFLAIVPGLTIMLLVLAFNILGNGLRDAMDVRN